MTPCDFHKITQILNYLARNAGSQNIIRRIKAIKLIYFADRYHLRKYGRLVTEDAYCGMKFGPVASLALNIARRTRLTPEMLGYINEYLKDIEEHYFASIHEVDMDYLANTDIEALDFSIQNFSKMEEFDLCDLSHSYPEWDSKKNHLNVFNKQFSIECLDFFKDADPNHKDLRFTNYHDLFKEIVSPGACESYLRKSQITHAITA